MGQDLLEALGADVILTKLQLVTREYTFELKRMEINSNLNSPISSTIVIRDRHIEDPKIKESLKNLIANYQDLFSTNLPTRNDALVPFQHTIPITNNTPIFSKPYRTSEFQRTEQAKQVQKLLENGIIRPSTSPWSSPVSLVSKKMDASGQKKWRMVVDFRKLNTITIEDKFPLPNIIDIFDRLGSASIFSLLDLSNGFHQIPVYEKDIPKTAFSTENGHYEYLRMPFGLKNAPASFQRMMNSILQNLIGKICFVYLDDIIIFSTSIENHNFDLKTVFNQLRRYSLRIQPDKSEFYLTQVKYLGHIVSIKGISPDPEKTSKLKTYPQPKNIKEVQQFLGLAGYYRKFVPNYSSISKPLTLLLHKNCKFEWNNQTQEAFSKLIKILTSDLLLQYPDFSKTFYLNTDASNFAIGAVLQQHSKENQLLPISYTSRTLNKAELNYSTIEKETLAIVWSVKYFRPYLFGQNFKILSDHKPLQWLFKVNDPGSRLLRWRIKLEEYNYTISHVSGTQNSVADALSRINCVSTQKRIDLMPEVTHSEADVIIIFTSPDLVQTNPLTEHYKQPIQIGEVAETKLKNKIVLIACVKDSKIGRRIKEIFQQIVETAKEICSKLKPNIIALFDEFDSFTKAAQRPNLEMVLRNLFSPMKIAWLKFKRTPENRLLFLLKTHNDKLCNHPGYDRMYQMLYKEQGYYWLGMKNDIREIIKQCDTCQRTKINRHPIKLPMVITDTAIKPLDKISLDIIGPLPKTKNNEIYILSLQDDLTKFIQLYPLKNKNSISISTPLSLFISTFGILKCIRTDKGSEFSSAFIEEIYTNFGIQHVSTTPYHPEGNGALERMHQDLKDFLKRNLNETKTDWNEQIITYVLHYNSSIHSSTKHTPYELLFARTPNRPYLQEEQQEFNYNEYKQEMQEKFEEIHKQAREQQVKTKLKTKKSYDTRHTSKKKFEPNDLVLLKTKDKQRAKRSLQAPNEGPYKVIKFKDPNVTILMNGHEETFHSKLIRPYVTPTTSSHLSMPILAIMLLTLLFPCISAQHIIPITNPSGLYFKKNRNC
ncbi:hypothetical protein PGB90_007540 [Kerria lacca]